VAVAVAMRAGLTSGVQTAPAAVAALPPLHQRDERRAIRPDRRFVLVDVVGRHQAASASELGAGSVSGVMLLR
jgi:hypothetical protein